MRIINFIRARFKKFLLEERWIDDYIKMGMNIGQNCSIQPGVVFDYSHCWLIDIGNNVTIAPQAYILAHDASTKKLLGYTKIGRVSIEDDVFIGARALIMPGVKIGKGSIIGANSTVTKSIPNNVVAVGNPAKIICSVQEYKENQKLLLKESKMNDLVFNKDYTLKGNIDSMKKIEMFDRLEKSNGYIK